MGGTGDIGEAGSALEGWRARGADRVNVTRFRFIEALARRAQAYDGDVRRVLDARVAALVAEYAAEIERAGAAADAVATDAGTHPSTPRRGALAELADLLAGRATDATASEASMGADALAAHRRERSPDLPMLDYFRETWSKFSTEKQLRQSLETVPENAGPLNSSHLVHRSLSLMRSVSPGYLQHFLSYVEALSWMEHLSGPAPAAPTAVAAQAPRASGAKKSTRGKAR
ncbi:DUF2894 domain-containing protein [Trinickia dabaoshanensis]|uniref:DUF2894 domain-containing protein n=2 Tax=Trinickia dabaoshanensis TaxID=564714 RepID=A0A2N7VBU4_9BURK|nr:DUF2894 domain-containing protein [Trinickia dabaoshanensis]